MTRRYCVIKATHYFMLFLVNDVYLMMSFYSEITRLCNYTTFLMVMYKLRLAQGLFLPVCLCFNKWIAQ